MAPQVLAPAVRKISACDDCDKRKLRKRYGTTSSAKVHNKLGNSRFQLLLLDVDDKTERVGIIEKAAAVMVGFVLGLFGPSRVDDRDRGLEVFRSRQIRYKALDFSLSSPLQSLLLDVVMPFYTMDMDFKEFEAVTTASSLHPCHWLQ